MNEHTRYILMKPFYAVRRFLYKIAQQFGYRYNLDIYNDTFFASNRDYGLRTAEWFFPVLLDRFHFKSLIDIGCATGHYLYHAEKHGITDIIGLEGSENAFNMLLVDRSKVIFYDLRDPYKTDRKWDIALSIEVAEHIDEKYADIYVDTMTQVSDLVVMTAATPGQGGTAHVNEQPHKWWVDKFQKRGFNFDTKSTNWLKNEISKAKDQGKFVEPWLLPNIMVFRRI